jgi:hypothetical protein
MLKGQKQVFVRNCIFIKNSGITLDRLAVCHGDQHKYSKWALQSYA